MIIEVDRTSVQLREPADYRGLAVVVAPDVDDLDRSVEPWGRIDDDRAHVWIDIDYLSSMHRGNASVAGSEGFEAMIGYAKKSGWVSPDERSVRAHIDVS